MKFPKNYETRTGGVATLTRQEGNYYVGHLSENPTLEKRWGRYTLDSTESKDLDLMRAMKEEEIY